LELDGRLDIKLAEGFTPDIGATYTIVQGQTRTGEFATVTGLAISSDRKFEVSYAANKVNLTVVAIP
jgi:hypothetical protein